MVLGLCALFPIFILKVLSLFVLICFTLPFFVSCYLSNCLLSAYIIQCFAVCWLGPAHLSLCLTHTSFPLNCLHIYFTCAFFLHPFQQECMRGSRKQQCFISLTSTTNTCTATVCISNVYHPEAQEPNLLAEYLHLIYL